MTHFLNLLLNSICGHVRYFRAVAIATFPLVSLVLLGMTVVFGLNAWMSASIALTVSAFVCTASFIFMSVHFTMKDLAKGQRY